MYNYLKKIVLLIILAHNFTGCNNPTSPEKPEYNYSLLFDLTVNKKHQKLYIFKTAGKNEYVKTGFPDKKYLILNAVIELTNPNIYFNSFIIDSSIVKNPYYYKEFFYKNENDINLKPLTNYILNIKINNKIISGITQPPGNFDIITPYQNIVINRNTKTKIQWSKSINAYGYIINVSNNYSVIWNDTTHFLNEFFSVTTKDTSYIFDSSYFHNKGKGEIKIIAFDKNYYNHVIQKIPSAGIKGAYGYFGSSVMKSVTIKIN